MSSLYAVPDDTKPSEAAAEPEIEITSENIAECREGDTKAGIYQHTAADGRVVYSAWFDTAVHADYADDPEAMCDLAAVLSWAADRLAELKG